MPRTWAIFSLLGLCPGGKHPGEEVRHLASLPSRFRITNRRRWRRWRHRDCWWYLHQVSRISHISVGASDVDLFRCRKWRKVFFLSRACIHAWFLCISHSLIVLSKLTCQGQREGTLGLLSLAPLKRYATKLPGDASQPRDDRTPHDPVHIHDHPQRHRVRLVKRPHGEHDSVWRSRC